MDYNRPSPAIMLLRRRVKLLLHPTAVRIFSLIV
jgi:hypothetical protein